VEGWLSSEDATISFGSGSYGPVAAERDNDNSASV
jgi:hypothetical protein